ncbi:hypothetical protein SNE40_002582 [Patella caerulea]|uniref:THO complex subunit 5 n=1 Tax=Patella caerulea TaxID=87958 RepID=A0AAN8KE34_PATCE
MRVSGKMNNAVIDEKRIQATLQFVTLKKMNRLSHFRCRKVREATNEAKQRIDQYHLQLQNLLYEAMHLQKEINKCLEFKSKDEEIELVPVEQFYKEAPEEISKPKITENDDHQLTLSRLDWELEQRQRLSKKLKEVSCSKDEILKEIDTKQEYLDSLQPKLNSILEATKPVQSYLNMPYDETREQHQTALHLPHPLYVLYMQSSAYKDACDKYLKVTIEGDIHSAKTLDMSVQEIEEDSDSDNEEQEKKTRRRKTTEDRRSDKKQRVLRKHPLTVAMEISCKEGSKLLLTFSYLLQLEIITVQVKVIPSCLDAVQNSISGGDLLLPDSILNELYPGDHGNNTPNPANQYELQRMGLHEFSDYVSQVGRPYQWTQWLGGLQFLGDGNPVTVRSSFSSAYMQQTIKQLRKRLKARLALLHQLATLEKNSIPVSSCLIDMFPVKVLSRLVSWKRSTYEDFRSLDYTKNITEGDMVSETDIFFTAVMERGSAKLTCQVVVGADYPTVPPLFVVSISWQVQRNATNDVHIKELEEEVNVHYTELIKPKTRDNLLSNQLQRLLMCFDVYLETESHDLSGPVEIPKDKVFTRVARGPDRKKPYKYIPDLGIFTHR